MPTQDELKQAAAEAAMAFLPESGIIGLGTGSTALHVIRLLAERLTAADARAGQGRPTVTDQGPGAPPPSAHRFVGVATSRATAEAAARAGVPLLEEEGPWEVAVTFDGADEVSTELDVIKGGGGALLREKIVNDASRLNVIVVDDSKLSDRLGERFRLPIAVVRFGWQQTRRAVEAIAGPAELRERGGAPFLTDDGHYILDAATGPMADPAALEQALETIPGVVVTGLFVGRADIVVIAGPDGIEIRRKDRDA